MKILITGGASGLGRAITEKLAEAGEHELHITYRSAKKEAEALARKYTNITILHCDFNSREDVKDLIACIEEVCPQVLINNASGPLEQQHFHKIAPVDFKNVFKRDVLPVIEITQAAIEVFKKDRFGKIINIISSAIINKPPVGWSIYAANKAYLLAMHRSWATEYIKYNITSNAISPSMMKTNLLSSMDERMIEMIEQKHPLKKLVESKEVAKAVDYFIKAGQHVNGAHLVINSGEEIGL